MKTVMIIKDNIKFDIVLENVSGLVGEREEKPISFSFSQLIFGISLDQAKNLRDNLNELLDKIDKL